MEKLSAKKKMSVVREYFNGLSHDQIVSKTGVSKGAVAGIIGELKAGLFPEVESLGDMVDALRELAVGLKHANLVPGQCAVGLAALKRLAECGLEPADLEQIADILSLAGGEDQGKEFVAAVSHICEFQKKTGLKLDQIDGKITELETKAAELEPALKLVDKTKTEIIALKKERNEVTSVVGDLKKEHAYLNPVVTDLQKRQTSLIEQIKKEENITTDTHSALATWHKERQKLAKTGFTLEQLTEFSDRIRVIAADHHLPIKSLRERLLQELETLGKGLTLVAMLQKLDVQLTQKKEEIRQANKECSATTQAVVKLKIEQAALEQSIKATREAVGQEIMSIGPLAKDTIDGFAAILRQGSADALEEVRQLKDEALQVGRELGRYQEIVEANEWLADIQCLTKGSGSLDAMRVRAILLVVLRGGLLWTEVNRAKSHELLRLKLDQLVKELEQWR